MKVPHAPSERNPVEELFAAAVQRVAREFVRNRFRAMRVAELTEKLRPEVPEHLIRTVLELHRGGFEPREKGWFKPVPDVVEELAM
ncbi:MAG: hypothetical protein GC161_18485 [Planctomycetaceae bacterium]|nr:hypothetical protein [Planctomycetaceae bacterium]